MKTKILPKILLGAILGIVAFKSDAQNPGGVTAAPAIWYNPASYTTNTWPNSGTFTGCDLTNSGNPVYSNGDKASNYNPYVYYVFTNSTTLGILSTNDQVSYSNAITAAQATLLQQNTTFSGLLPTNLSGSATHAPSVFRFSDNQYAANHGYSIGGYNEGLPYCYISGFYNNGSGYVNEIGAGTADTFSYRSVILAMQPQAATSPVKFNFGLNGHYRTTTNSYYGPGYNGGAPSATTYQYICVGRGYYYGMEGRVFDQMVYSGALSTDQMYEVESYLGIKQGITLAHPYYAASDDGTSLGTTIWNTGNTGGYDNNIAGIGNETANGSLDQRQSNSVNAGQQVLIGTTGLGNSNSANGTNLTNGQYLMWGDNGLAKTPKIPETNIAGTNYRFAAVWKVQNTNAVGTVRVAWPAGLNGLKLVQSSDPTFASGNTATDMSANTQTVNGVTYNYADVTLADGQYFTFAANVVSPGGIASLPAVWYRPDSVSKSFWMDASLNKLNLTGQGTVTVNAGDAAHNFNSWTTGYSASNYYNFIDSTATNTDLETNPVFGNYNVNGYSYMPLTVFGVARDTLTSGSGLITGTDNEKANASEPGFGVYAAQQRFYRASYGAAASGTTAPVNVSGVYMWRPPAGISTASGTDTLLMGLNGGYTTAQINKVGSVVGPYLKIGYSASDWGAFPGNIQEVIWYKDSLGYGDIQKVETYLALKFGTTLAHSYVNAAGDTVYGFSANAGYLSNIAGIGHEAANGGLDQRQSNSVNTGKQVLISTTGLANTNDANSTGLAEGKYLIWGDNGLAKSPGVAISGISGVNYRFMSVWKVQNTGSVGTVRVAWPASGWTSLKLVQSSDPTFATGNMATDMASNTQTVDGVTYNYADVTLANGQYFTFAAQIDHAPGGVVHGLSEWFRADKQVDTTSAGAMVSWTDYTQQVPATQYSTNAVPNYLNGTATNLNFNPGINFTATNQTLANLSIQMLTSLNYDVFSATQNLAGSRYFGGAFNNTTLNGTNFDQPGIYTDGSMGTRDNQGNNWDVTNYAPQFAANTPNVMYYHYTDTSFDKGLNGAVVGTNTVHSFHTGAMTGGFVFGYNGGALGGDDAGFTGNVGELIVYGADSISAQERNRVDAYLAIKYGITLDNNESYLASNSSIVWDKTDNAAYYNNIAGIARDDMSALNQKQSRSQVTNNANGEITVGLGAIATNNATNANSFTNDQTWFIWGDNGVTTTLDAASAPFTAPAGTGVRMNRIWKAVNTGLSQAVELQFPQASVSATTGAHYVLIMANDENFTTNVSTIDLSATATGNNYTVTFTPRSGTFYFTFARLDVLATPVILKDVSVSTANCNATLSWTGATEINFNYYEVQSSTDGISFTPQQQVSAKGSGSRYTATIPLSAATEYLRLQMVDKDGSSENSDTYTVNSSCGVGTPVLYPNPASDVFNITNLGSGQKQIQVFSASGASVYKSQTTADKTTVNVKGWTPGIYMVSVATGTGKTVSFKVIVR